MVTGKNPVLTAALLMEQYRRNRLAVAAQETWVEAGYCIDAPALIAAGSHDSDVFGDGPTVVLRAPSNDEAHRRGAAGGPSGAAGS